MTAVFITVYRQRALPKINEERSVQGQINHIIPFQYFTYFDEHKLTGVMVTSQCVMFTYSGQLSPHFNSQYAH